MRALPDSGTLVRLHTATGIEWGRLLAPFRRNHPTLWYCFYPGPACDANTPADRLLELRTEAIRFLEQSAGTRGKESAVIGGIIGALLSVGVAS